jgi:hypothetical protein
MAQTTEFTSYNSLWREAKRWGVSGTSGSTATSCLVPAKDLAAALSAACGFSISYSGTAAQGSQTNQFLSNPTTA